MALSLLLGSQRLYPPLRPGAGGVLPTVTTHPESTGGMNLTFGVNITLKRDFQFIYTPNKAYIADGSVYSPLYYYIQY